MDFKTLTETWPEAPGSVPQNAARQTGRSQQLRSLLATVAHEALFAYHVIRRDISSAVVPGLFFCLAAWKDAGKSVGELVPILGRGLLYFAFYTFTFCLSNQIAGVKEDRVNKPDRPLPQRMVSLPGARLRWILAMYLYTCVGWWLDVLEWTLLWQAVTIVHNVLGGARSWLIKNLSMGLGVLAALEAGWRMAAPMTPAAWQWSLFLAVTVFVLVPLQDLRDIEGDKQSRRNTFPMAFGVTATRIFLGIGFFAQAVLTHLLLMQLAGSSWSVLACDLALGVVSLWIAYRVLARRTPEADHTTYMLYTYWYCIALASAFVVL